MSNIELDGNSGVITADGLQNADGGMPMPATIATRDAPDVQGHWDNNLTLGHHVSASSPSATITQATNELIDYAQLTSSRQVDLSGQWTINDTILVPSRIRLTGYGDEGAVFEMTGVNKPIFASQNYFSALSEFARGRVLIENLTVYGDITQPNNDCILLREAFSTIRNCRVINAGRNGIALTTRNDIGQPEIGTKVENRVENCTSIFAQDNCFFLGEEDSQQLTDGYFLNCIARSDSGGSTQRHLYIGAAAGWVLDGLHAYGTPTQQESVYISNLNYTRVRRFYIERFRNRGIYARKIQRSSSIHANIDCSSSNQDAIAVQLTRSSGYSDTSFNLDLQLAQDSNVSVIGVHNHSWNLKVNANITVEGPFRRRIRKFAARTPLIEGQFAPSHKGLFASKRVTGAGQQSVDLATLEIPSYGKVIGTLTIIANHWDNGPLRAQYVAQVMISAKVNGTHDWQIIPIEQVTATGFRTSPVLGANYVDDDTGQLTVDFAFSDASATGLVSLSYNPAV